MRAHPASTQAIAAAAAAAQAQAQAQAQLLRAQSQGGPAGVSPYMLLQQYSAAGQAAGSHPHALSPQQQLQQPMQLVWAQPAAGGGMQLAAGPGGQFFAAPGGVQ